jgi:hypothetical protein
VSQNKHPVDIALPLASPNQRAFAGMTVYSTTKSGRAGQAWGTEARCDPWRCAPPAKREHAFPGAARRKADDGTLGAARLPAKRERLPWGGPAEG